ncbi:MAG: UDP-N-acetylmuramoyl-tripeptide--D-alanyl-D-alanine ligase [Patescibacteria group bacterium]|nr:UDP-N-acetylmuramoyl-tripeptide--D-alanyl-D-alanine ligase [Patescibacteria group bacterium]
MNKLVKYILKILTRGVVKKHHPLVIGITGSVGKTSTKEAVFTVLNSKFNVRKSEKNYNNEFGLPFTILGTDAPGKSILAWLKILFKAISLNLIKCSTFPEILVLEMAADHPGDIAYLLSICKPQISIVTTVAPVHLEYFKTIEKVAREKRRIIEILDKKGLAILNADDEHVFSFREKTQAQILTYGFSDISDIKAEEITIRQELDHGSQELENVVGGISFKLTYRGSVVPVFLPGVLGRHQIYSILAAAAVGIYRDMNLVEISEALRNYQSPPGRMKLIEGIKHTYIIDDTYNSSPRSVKAGLETLSELTVQARKIAVLGDMLELGSFTEEGHRDVGRVVAISHVDILVTVGEKSNDTILGAKKAGMAEENLFHFDKTEEAGRFLQDKIKEGDLILIKGSQGMRMEKIVKELMAEPLRAEELLVRQGEKWLKKQKTFSGFLL